MAGHPVLVITVDTEADNEWEVYRIPSYHNIAALPTFQALCERYGAKPTYLVTYDVAMRPECTDVLRSIRDGGRAEIGAHLHGWRTPPFHREPPGVKVGQPYINEYSVQTQRAKLEHLTAMLAEVFGERPTSFRAGRWALGEVGLMLLEELDYQVDSSVVPLTDLRCSVGHSPTCAGPDYSRAPCRPYYPSRTDVLKTGDASVLEVPPTVGVIGPLRGPLLSLVASSSPLKGCGRKTLAATRLARTVRLNPVTHELNSMLHLAKLLTADGVPVLNVSLHSSEWIAGQSRLVTDEAAQRKVHERMEGLLEYLAPRTTAMGLAEFAAGWKRVPEPNATVETTEMHEKECSRTWPPA